ELADALKGGSLQTRQGRPLVRTTAANPPSEPSDQSRRRMFRDQRERQALASLLQVPEGRVRLIEQRQSLMEQVATGRGPPPAPPQGSRPGPPRDLPRVGPDGAVRPPLGTWRGPFGWRENVLFGEFVAAVQQPSGAWTVVR